MFGFKSKQDKENEAISAQTIHDIGDYLAMQTDLRGDTSWQSFGLLGWLDTTPQVIAYKYVDGQAINLPVDQTIMLEHLSRLQAATVTKDGRSWRATTMTYVHEVGDIKGDFFYGNEADVYDPALHAATFPDLLRSKS